MSRGQHENTPERDKALDAMYERVRIETERERGIFAFLKSRPTKMRVAIAMSIAALLTVAVAWGRGGCTTSMPHLVSGAVLLLLAALASVVSLRPLYREALSRGWTFSALGFGGVLALGSMALVVRDPEPGLSIGPCALWGMSTASLTFVSIEVLSRRAGRSTLFGAAAALLVGAAAVQLTCPADHLGHVLFDHFGLLGLVVGVIAIARSLTAVARRSPTG